jgi:hypothetical protein
MQKALVLERYFLYIPLLEKKNEKVRDEKNLL